MQKNDYTEEPWWNCLTAKEREEILRQAEEQGELKKQPLKQTQPWKGKYIDLFGWG